MENPNVKKTNYVAILLGVAFAAAGIVGAYQFQEANEAKDELQANKVETQELAEKRDGLENRVNQLSAELEAKIKESEEAAAKLEEMEAVEAKRKSYSYVANKKREKMLAEQALREQQIDSLQNQLFELNKVKDQMAEELKVIPELEKENADLKDEVAQWEEKYAALEADFKDLETRYAKVIYDAPADNFRVEVMARNGKLTSKAKKARTITVSFLMPDFLQQNLKDKETLYLSLFDDQINPLPGYSEEISIDTKTGSIPVQVHAKKDIDASEAPQVISFKVDVPDGLETGFYKGKVYSKNNYYGTVDFRLR
ncbi:hypothetical protein LAG90_08385 [Marinilongibacter aquaticus]|uniref:hypothetical protein n=1 Tax=Marinilongibacter aquaticus TaxID=2975157 RepID=UPI0021BD1E6D|nr:hypothetical protein [Marinilongibacter aquaticus]UBM60657.1 hypothetical protein LAG90_08385 [Marinilongibacter aquaticus]